MKKNFFIHALLASFLLVSCQNSFQEKNNNTNEVESYEEENVSNSNVKPETQRLSYSEYQEKYGSLLSQQGTTNSTTGELLSTYSTSLESSSDERINNIEIVCKRLNNYILKPNETFSYNNVTGPFGEDDGFEKAPILLQNGEKTKGYGGGVCQLSSTLYNVVKNINNVDITERHHHSSPVSYVPKNEDATVSLQSNLDFQFVNRNPFSIQFNAACENNKVTVWAYKISE